MGYLWASGDRVSREFCGTKQGYDSLPFQTSLGYANHLFAELMESRPDLRAPEARPQERLAMRLPGQLDVSFRRCNPTYPEAELKDSEFFVAFSMLPWLPIPQYGSRCLLHRAASARSCRAVKSTAITHARTIFLLGTTSSVLVRLWNTERLADGIQDFFTMNNEHRGI